MNIERQLEINSDRRERANDRYYDMLIAKETACDALIGTLCREGKTVPYINCQTRDGRYTGKTREFPNSAEAVHFLIRNHYV